MPRAMRRKRRTSSSPFSRGRVLIPGVAAGTTLLVQVSADWDLIFTGTMDLAIYRDACAAPDPFEPNDTPATATPISAGLYPGLSVSNPPLGSAQE